MNRRVTTMLGVALATAVLAASATSAQASLKCKETLLNGSAKLTQTLAKVLQKCNQSVHDGKVTGPCPDSKSAASIATAESKLKAAIQKDCVGSVGEFPFGHCPNEVTSGPGVCTNILIQNEGNIGDCLNCLADHNATELEKVLYGSLLTAGTSDIAKCQKTAGQTTTALYIAKSKAMGKCQLLVLKGKLPGPCPDAKAQAAIAKAESKKVASITKTCCGADGVCGGATCSQSTTPVCIGGANASVACTAGSECPGGICSTTSVICQGGTNDGGICSVDSACPGGACVSTSVGDACEAASDCGRCRGGTTPGESCRSNGECHSNPGACDTGINQCVGGSNDGFACQLKCKGGANNGAVCSVASECPGGACNGAIDCPSIGGGTCIGATGFCGGADDLRPIQDLGYPDPCPGITAGGSAIELMGQTGVGLLGCVDPQADDRADCQVAASAPFFNGGLLPPICIDALAECTSDGGSKTVTVSLVLDPSVTDIAGVSISLGYTGILLPGHGEVAFPGPVMNLQSGNIQAEDRDDALITSIADLGGLSAGPLYTVQFSTCGTPPVVGNFGCVVRSASDGGGHENPRWCQLRRDIDHVVAPPTPSSEAMGRPLSGGRPIVAKATPTMEGAQRMTAGRFEVGTLSTRTVCALCALIFALRAERAEAFRCDPAGTMRVVVALGPPPGTTIAGVVLDVGYPDRTVTIPGSGDGPEVKARFTGLPEGFLSNPNDLDDKVMVAVAGTSALPAGPLFTVEFDRCRGTALPGAKDFHCKVTQASTEKGVLVDGTTCTATIAVEAPGTKTHKKGGSV